MISMLTSDAADTSVGVWVGLGGTVVAVGGCVAVGVGVAGVSPPQAIAAAPTTAAPSIAPYTVQRFILNLISERVTPISMVCPSASTDALGRGPLLHTYDATVGISHLQSRNGTDRYRLIPDPASLHRRHHRASVALLDVEVHPLVVLLE